jgi:hypothetical protein
MVRFILSTCPFVAKEIGGDFRHRLLMQLDEGELRGPVDGDEEMELASSVRTSAISIWKKPIG